MQTSFGLRQPGWIAEFRAFIARGNVVDLAIGIIIGVAFRGRSSRVIRILHRGGRGPSRRDEAGFGGKDGAG